LLSCSPRVAVRPLAQFLSGCLSLQYFLYGTAPPLHPWATADAFQHSQPSQTTPRDSRTLQPASSQPGNTGGQRGIPYFHRSTVKLYHHNHPPTFACELPSPPPRGVIAFARLGSLSPSLRSRLSNPTRRRRGDPRVCISLPDVTFGPYKSARQVLRRWQGQVCQVRTARTARLPERLRIIRQPPTCHPSTSTRMPPVVTPATVAQGLTDRVGTAIA
jgi:hypothetical protein